MRIALISDVHGNLDALRRVLQDVGRRGPDRLVCLGDVVSFGPHPRECLEIVAGLPNAVLIRGNHDRYVGGEVFRTDGFSSRWPRGFVQNEEWTYSQLEPLHLATLTSWSTSRALEVDSVAVSLVHASAESDEYLLWPNAPTAEFKRVLGVGGLRAYGHIHQQFARRVRGTTYLNPGSVGFPFDRDPRAAYALVTIAGRKCRTELVRTEYDLRSTIAALRDKKAPWLSHIQAALEQSVSFFSPELSVVSRE